MHKKIKCPKCDNEDLSFVSGTKKGLNVFLLLIVAVLGVAVIITLFVSGYIWGAVIAIIIFFYYSFNFESDSIKTKRRSSH